MSQNILQEKHQLGIGGVAIGTAFNDISDEQSYAILKTAWDAGIRYFDTSPWYGLTKSERRFGDLLADKNRSEFVFQPKFDAYLKKFYLQKCHQQCGRNH